MSARGQALGRGSGARGPAVGRGGSARGQAVGLALVLVGCEPGGQARPGDPELVRAAEQIFATRCATCHGPRGRGDGPAGRGLWPPPRDFGDAAWQASVADDRLRAVIVGGGAAVGLSTQMQANPDLAGSPVLVGELIRIVRGFSSGHGEEDMSKSEATKPPGAAPGLSP